MCQTLAGLPAEQPTEHAMLVVWGQFAQELGLLEQLAQVPIPQKTVQHSPAAKLATLFLGLLSGIEYLTDLTRAATPLYHDPAVATAWGLAALPEASGVSRTLAAATPQSFQGLQQVLGSLSAPFLEQALADLRSRQRPLVLDADLTGQPVSDTSTSYPQAAFGYMDGEIRLGYQLAVLCLRTGRYGRQWLVGQQHPGDMVSAPCLLDLVAQAEHCLGLHPRRRPELLQQRIAAVEAEAQVAEQRAQEHGALAAQALAREERLLGQIEAAQHQFRTLQKHPASTRQRGPYGALSRLRQQLAVWERQLGRTRQQWATAVGRAERAAAQAEAIRARIPALQARRDSLAAENAGQTDRPRVVMRLDAGFSTGENLTVLLELGYEIETKSGNAALVQALLDRVTTDTSWTRVGKNAEMIGWTGYQLSSCPYPLTVGLERFHTPSGDKHAVLLRYQADRDAGCPDLATWFRAYNGRGDVEAGIKQTKSVFHVQHLLSRSPVGMQIQVALTLFAANFVQWAQVWLRERLVGPPKPLLAVLGQVKRLVQVLANSPARVEHGPGQLVVRFSPASSFAGLVICVSRGPAVQLMLPLFESTAGQRVVECFMELLKCEKPAAAEPIGSRLHNS
jgi:hypothetical protein